MQSDLKYAKLDFRPANATNFAAQSVQTVISKTGIMSSFADNFGLYKIASTDISISKEQAIATAMQTINAYAEQNNRKITSIEATFAYVTDFNGSRGDSFLIYPQWQVSATFDKSDNDIFGYGVLIWADNGQISSENAQGIYKNTSNVSATGALDSNTIIAITIVSLSVSIIALVYVRKRIGPNANKRAATFKIGGIVLICAFFSSAVLVQPCSAEFPVTALGSSYGIQYGEAYYDSLIAGQIADWAYNAGLGSYNWYGSSHTDILIAARDHGETASTAFYVGHGGYTASPLNFWVTDENGDLVEGLDFVYGAWMQNSGHHKCAFIWSCYSGEELPMATAWLHPTQGPLSTNGFTSPDGTRLAFVGFDGVAPYITLPIESHQYAGYDFLCQFYDAFIGSDYTVNAALNYASQMLWYENFEYTTFYNGYTIDGYDGRMVVYGDGGFYISEWL